MVVLLESGVMRKDTTPDSNTAMPYIEVDALYPDS
jgi:hypothetical protein